VSEENSQIAAINRMAELSTTMITIVLQEVRDLKTTDHDILDLLHEIQVTNKEYAKMIADLKLKIDGFERHIRNDMVDTLTAPLLDLQSKNSQRRREISRRLPLDKD